MIRISIFFFIIFAGYNAQSQIIISLLFGEKLNSPNIEFGMDGGLSVSNINGLDYTSDKWEGERGNWARTFNLGFYFDIKTKNPCWLFHTGLIVKSNMGEQNLPTYFVGNASLDTVFQDGEVYRRLNYFNMPIMMKYKINKRFFIEGGIMPALRTKGNDTFTKEVDGTELQYTKDVHNGYHRLDFGMIGGFGYRLMGGNGLNLGIRYYYGMIDIAINDATPNQFNRCWYFNVGIPIGAAKKNN